MRMGRGCARDYCSFAYSALAYFSRDSLSLDVPDQYYVPVCYATIHDKVLAVPRQIEAVDQMPVEASDLGG